MEVKCEYCGSLIPDNVDKCPNCGAVNENMQRSAIDVPQTIRQLEQWYKDHHLPPYEETRFFIGINCKEPKAFGIYQDGDNFIVYKNKSDGSRSIRYKGTDEDYAVNELYLKLKAEIVNQKEHTKNTASRYSRQTRSNAVSSDYRSGRRKKKNFKFPFFLIICIIIAVLVVACSAYIKDSSTPYSSGGGSGYYVPVLYDDGTTWWDDNTSYDYDYNDSSYYDDDDYDIWDTWDSDWDNSYDWDSGSDWDYDWSDWDSDW